MDICSKDCGKRIWPRTAAELTRIGIVGVLLAVLGACASKPPTTLAEIRHDAARRLMVKCYWEQKGARRIAGPRPVMQACSEWARKAVKVRYSYSTAQAQGPSHM